MKSRSHHPYDRLGADETSSALVVHSRASAVDDELQALKKELEDERRRTENLRTELGVSRGDRHRTVQPHGAGYERTHQSVKVPAKEAKPVIDWEEPPDPQIASTARLYQRPAYVPQQLREENVLLEELNAKYKRLGEHLAGEHARVRELRTDTATCRPEDRTDDEKATGKDTLKKINKFSNSIADLVSQLKLKRLGESAKSTLKKIPFDRDIAARTQKGWTKEPKTQEGDEVKAYPLWSTSDAEMGSFGGVGLRLYFYVLKFLSVLFCMMALTTLPALTSFASNDLYANPSAKRFRTKMAEFTLGNVNVNGSNIETGNSPSLFVASESDALATLAAVIAALWLGLKMSTIVKENDLENATMQDYSVQIYPVSPVGLCKRSHNSGAPAAAAAAATTWENYESAKGPDRLWEVGGTEIQRFHNDIKRALEDKVNELDPKVKQKVIIALNTHDDSNDPSAPYIWSTWDEERNFKLWGKRTNLLYELEEALSIARSFQMRDPREKIITEEARLTTIIQPTLQKLQSLETEMKALNRDDKKYKPVAAFVTFENPKHQILLVKDGGEIEIDGCKCKITEAPEPETVQFGHLNYSSTNRRMRKTAMELCTLLLLFVGFIGCVIARKYAESLQYTVGCKFVLGPDADDASEWEHQLDGILELTQLCDRASPCPGLLAFNDTRDLSKVYHYAYDKLKASHHLITFPKIDTIPAELLPRHRKCRRWNEWVPSDDGANASCHRVDGRGADTILYPGGDMDSMCYACACRLPTLTEEVADLHGEDYCESFDADQQISSVWQKVAVVMTVAINQALKRGIKGSIHWLKAHTLETQMESQAIRVFLCQLQNTAVLTLLLKSTFGPFDELPGHHYTGPNGKWYAEIAAPMVVTMAIQFVTPWAVHALTFAVDWITRRIAARCARTQNALNRSQSPSDFDIAGSYGEVLLAVFVTLLFGSGVPLLYWVAAVGFFVRYWVDKYVVLCLSKRPPMYSEKLIENFDELCMLALLAHAGMGCYLLANAGGTNPADEPLFRPFSPHMFPMLIMLVLTACATVVNMVLDDSEGLSSSENDTKEKLVTFGEAMAQSDIANDMEHYEGEVVKHHDELSKAFENAVTQARADHKAPFTATPDDAVYQKVMDCVRSKKDD